MTPSVFGGNVARALTTVSLLCGGAGWAHAQGIGPAGSLQSTQGQAPSFSKEQLDKSLQAPRAPPVALPGAAPKQQAIAPPTQVPTLMSPTDELFDAINRGDMATVRDALNRGADLSTPNQLGLTPLDLSIDLGRNDISFLLLSMRGAAPSQTGPVQTAKTGHPSATRVVQRTTRQRGKLTQTAQAGQPSLPTLFSGDGGAPVPRAGFLGFTGR
ncbi:MAG: hypothetical protein WBQ75_23285 [Acetobacteraceae bacterium]